MIDKINTASHSLQAQNTATETKKVLRMVKNERMGGMVPVWETIKVSKAESITQAAQTQQTETATFENILAYQNTQAPINEDAPEDFGFGDLIDMINPLHHIPIVGHIYRNLTGDEIKPIGQIIGGAVFGGPLGAASSLVNAIIKEETGKGLAENAIDLAFKNQAPTFRTAKNEQNNPQEILDKATRTAGKPSGQNDLPASLLAFTNNNHESVNMGHKPVSNGRTAGTIIYRMPSPDISAELLLARDPITEITLRRMPEKYKSVN